MYAGDLMNILKNTRYDHINMTRRAVIRNMFLAYPFTKYADEQDPSTNPSMNGLDYLLYHSITATIIDFYYLLPVIVLSPGIASAMSKQAFPSSWTEVDAILLADLLIKAVKQSRTFQKEHMTCITIMDYVQLMFSGCCGTHVQWSISRHR